MSLLVEAGRAATMILDGCGKPVPLFLRWTGKSVEVTKFLPLKQTSGCKIGTYTADITIGELIADMRATVALMGNAKARAG